MSQQGDRPEQRPNHKPHPSTNHHFNRTMGLLVNTMYVWITVARVRDWTWGELFQEIPQDPTARRL